MRRTAFIAMTLVCVWVGIGSGQQSADVFKVDYFDNANTNGAPDGKLRLTNPGTSGGRICASVFVFDQLQELQACCSCLLSPNGLRKLSVNTDLTSDPLTGVVMTTGSIEIVSTEPLAGACPAPVSMKPVATLLAWATHIQDSTFVETEAASQSATLSSTELNTLNEGCYAIQLGTGGGTCTCGTGD
jgi:hypothetical protein